MSSREIISLPTTPAFERYVLETVCRAHRWEPEAVRSTRRPIRRGGRLCGLMLQFAGPKNLKCHVIWAEAEYRLLFYDTSGKRNSEVHLAETPDLSEWFQDRAAA